MNKKKYPQKSETPAEKTDRITRSREIFIQRYQRLKANGLLRKK